MRTWLASLGGWWRLWLVISAAWMLIIGITGGGEHEETAYSELLSGDLVNGEPTDEFKGSVDRAVAEAQETCPGRPIEVLGYEAIGAAHGSPPRFEFTNGRQIKVEAAQNLVSCRSNANLWDFKRRVALIMVLIPILLVLLGFLVRWVFSGFSKRI
jgi:hypothetical protein